MMSDIETFNKCIIKRMMSDIETFNKCITKRTRKNGNTSINCNLGLWGVSAPTEDQATVEALHYWHQYKEDGEYSEIIGGKSVVDKLIEHNRG